MTYTTWCVHTRAHMRVVPCPGMSCRVVSCATRVRTRACVHALARPTELRVQHAVRRAVVGTRPAHAALVGFAEPLSSPSASTETAEPSAKPARSMAPARVRKRPSQPALSTSLLVRTPCRTAPTEPQPLIIAETEAARFGSSCMPACSTSIRAEPPPRTPSGPAMLKPTRRMATTCSPSGTAPMLADAAVQPAKQADVAKQRWREMAKVAPP
mmetsp:Transcript_38539/g.82113  ORF Transcript_38539/g.82113 Transcript_38539/m.82113 type:complete len:213 (-) Transcript_38539:364-1002(-)